MTRRSVTCLALLAATAALVGCQKREASTPGGPGAQGRYFGVGIYEPKRPWTQMVKAAEAQKAGPEAAARTADDQAVIVVVDSRTGEIRACGDLSGYCVGQNPWSRPAQSAPVDLAEHVTVFPRVELAEPAKAPAEN